MLLHLDFPETVERCEEYGLSSTLALPSSWNESVLKDVLEAERLTQTHIPFPIITPAASHLGCGGGA